MAEDRLCFPSSFNWEGGFLSPLTPRTVLGSGHHPRDRAWTPMSCLVRGKSNSRDEPQHLAAGRKYRNYMIFKLAETKWAHFKSSDFNLAHQLSAVSFYVQLQEYSRYFFLEKKKSWVNSQRMPPWSVQEPALFFPVLPRTCLCNRYTTGITCDTSCNRAKRQCFLCTAGCFSTSQDREMSLWSSLLPQEWKV